MHLEKYLNTSTNSDFFLALLYAIPSKMYSRISENLSDGNSF